MRSCVSGSFSAEVDLTNITQPIDGIRVRVNDNSDEATPWTFRNGHFILYKYPSSLSFNSKGLKRITERSILDLYTDPARLKPFITQLIAVVHDKAELEHTRLSILSHLNRLQLEENVKVLRDNFDFKSFLEDPDLYAYSDQFKAVIFNTINKIGLTDIDGQDRSFFEYTSGLLDSIQGSGVPNFDITTMRLIYTVNKDVRQEAFQKNYRLLTDFVFTKALPALEKSNQYFSVSFNPSLSDHVSAGVLVCRAKSKYELTSDLGTLHSIDKVKLLFDEDTFGLVLAMKVRVYAVDDANNETLLLKTTFGDDAYQLCTRRQSSKGASQARPSGCCISLAGVEAVSRYFRVKIQHVNTAQAKSQGDAAGQDPLHAIVPLYFGQDTGIQAPVNSVFKALKTEVSQSANKLDDVLSLDGLDFHCYEKLYAYLSPKKFTKKDLKTLSEHEAAAKLLAAKQKEQVELIKSRDYAKAHELTKEIRTLKTKSRSKQASFNNLTLSETLVLSSEIMNYLSSSEFSENK